MLKVMLGFLPWIAYFLLTGNTRSSHIIAVSVALLITLVLDRQELKKGFILTWGGLLFFIGLLGINVFTSFTWPIAHASLLGNTALMLIVWFSLCIRKPFTIQYAREQTDPRYWNSPVFIRINDILTFVWGISFIMLTLMSLGRHYFDIADNWIYQTATYVPTIMAIWFTQQFPEWYQAKFEKNTVKESFEKQTHEKNEQG